MPDFHLTPGQSHMLTHFITEETWKFEKAREIKKAQYRKEKLLNKNVVRMTPEELLQAQSEIQALSNDFDAYYADWQGAKVRFVNLTKKFTNVAAPKQQLDEVLGQVQRRNRSHSMCLLMMKLLMMNLQKSSETDR